MLPALQERLKGGSERSIQAVYRTQVKLGSPAIQGRVANQPGAAIDQTDDDCLPGVRRSIVSQNFELSQYLRESHQGLRTINFEDYGMRRQSQDSSLNFEAVVDLEANDARRTAYNGVDSLASGSLLHAVTGFAQ
jgi:hypothetical protein